MSVWNYRSVNSRKNVVSLSENGGGWGGLGSVSKQKGSNLHINYLIKYMLETLLNWIIRSVDWNISWIYQIFCEVGSVRPLAKNLNLHYVYLIRYIHDFYFDSILYYGDYENNKTYQNVNVWWKRCLAQIQSRKRVKISLLLPHTTYAWFLL